MTFLHEKSDLQSPALEGLRQFVLARREQWATGTPDFEQFEHELHQQIMALERELLADELAGLQAERDQLRDSILSGVLKVSSADKTGRSGSRRLNS